MVVQWFTLVTFFGEILLGKEINENFLKTIIFDQIQVLSQISNEADRMLNYSQISIFPPRIPTFSQNVLPLESGFWKSPFFVTFISIKFCQWP